MRKKSRLIETTLVVSSYLFQEIYGHRSTVDRRLYKRSSTRERISNQKMNFQANTIAIEHDIERNEEIPMKRLKLEFQHGNQNSTTENDTKILKFLIIVLSIIFIFCLITLTELALLTERFGKRLS